MGTGWNMPDGVTESMIPGYNDVEMDIEFQCDNEDCGNEWTESDMTVDPTCGGHEVEAVCPECEKLVKFDWEPYIPDYRYD
jgi:hypothetical protein